MPLPESRISTRTPCPQLGTTSTTHQHRSTLLLDAPALPQRRAADTPRPERTHRCPRRRGYERRNDQRKRRDSVMTCLAHRSGRCQGKKLGFHATRGANSRFTLVTARNFARGERFRVRRCVTTLAVASASKDASPPRRMSWPLATTSARIEGSAAAGSALTNAVIILIHLPFDSFRTRNVRRGSALGKLINPTLMHKPNTGSGSPGASCKRGANAYGGTSERDEPGAEARRGRAPVVAMGGRGGEVG